MTAQNCYREWDNRAFRRNEIALPHLCVLSHRDAGSAAGDTEPLWNMDLPALGHGWAADVPVTAGTAAHHAC